MFDPAPHPMAIAWPAESIAIDSTPSPTKANPLNGATNVAAPVAGLIV
jgi:hypothetical protein